MVRNFFVPQFYPKDAYGRLEYDKKLTEQLNTHSNPLKKKLCEKI